MAVCWRDECLQVALWFLLFVRKLGGGVLAAGVRCEPHEPVQRGRCPRWTGLLSVIRGLKVVFFDM